MINKNTLNSVHQTTKRWSEVGNLCSLSDAYNTHLKEAISKWQSLETDLMKLHHHNQIQTN